MSFHHRPLKPNSYIISEIETYFRYNPDTGELRRFNKSHSEWCSVKAGQNKQVGFRINGKIEKFIVTNVCWYLYYKSWPDSEIDHKDRNPENNKVSNLRASNRSQQILNSKVRSGKYLPGVSFYKGRYQARIKADQSSKNIHLGMYPTEILAHEAYRRAYYEKHGVELDYPYLEWHKPQVEEVSAGELSPEALADYRAFCEAVKTCNQ